MPTVSVVITCQNNEDIIGDCLESAKWADEIVAVDAFSKDGTCEIVSRYAEKIIKVDPRLNSGEMWNKGIDAAKGDWIFVLESDKRVPGDLRAELDKLFRRQKADEADGYLIKTRNYFLGCWLKTKNLYPDYKLYIFKNGFARFEERHRGCLVFKGKTKKLNGSIEHYVFRSLEQSFAKINKESDILAEEFFRKREAFSKRALILKPYKVFKKQYFKHGGSREGMAGLLFSFVCAFESFLLYAKQWEKTVGMTDTGKG